MDLFYQISWYFFFFNSFTSTEDFASPGLRYAYAQRLIWDYVKQGGTWHFRVGYQSHSILVSNEQTNENPL